MNYGIEEIENFKYPSRKPWLVLIAVVLAGLVAVLAVRSSRIRRDRASAVPAEIVVSTTTTTTLPPVRVRTAADERKIRRKPPVDLAVSSDQRVSSTEEAAAGIDKGAALLAAGARIEARKELLGALMSAGDSQQRSRIEEMLSSLNVELALKPYDMPEKIDYVVQRGDSLDKISKKYGVTVESIKIGNAVSNPNLIKAGDHLRVLDADFTVEVRKEAHELVLLMNGLFFKRYKVGLGKFDKTPLGTFEVYDRISEPVWWRPDGKEIPFGHAENILGTRWMAIRATGDTPPVKGYGIHGTWDDASIGKSESAGCVRMHNRDVEELYNLLPLGTQVTILK